MGVACMWLGIASTKSYTPLVVGRAFLGIFEAPIESIVPSTITDIFFLHDRGAKVSLYGLSVLGGNELGPMFSAFIIQALGMNWAFYIVGIFVFANVVSIFFTMPETKFTGLRPSTVPSALTDPVEKEAATAHVESADEEVKPKQSYVHELAFWGRSDPKVSLQKVFFRPFVLLCYPTVLWSCLVYGMALSWNVILGASIAQIFAPPYANSSPSLTFQVLWR